MAGEAEIAKFTNERLIRRGKDLVRACHVPSVKLNSSREWYIVNNL